MPSFTKGGGLRPPFGKNQYLRSTRGTKFESYTLYAGSVTAESIDGVSMKIAQSGTVMAKITSGAGSGMVGPFQAGVTDGRQTTGNIVGLLETFLPWELNERDADVAVLYDGAAVQAWCFELNAGGARIALTNTTRDAMVALATLALLFK